jgi:hypothetical protein
MGKAVEWSLNMMTTGAMKLRELERTAKQNKKGIWLNYVPQVSNSAAGPLFPAVGRPLLSLWFASFRCAAPLTVHVHRWLCMWAQRVHGDCACGASAHRTCLNSLGEG